MLRSWKPIVVALLSYWVWSHKHAFQAQLVPKDLPKLFDAGADCKMISGQETNSQFKFCEDGVVVAPGITIFSCDPGRLKWNTIMGPMLDPEPRGALWAAHYTSSSLVQPPYSLELVDFPTDADFHPLGIDIAPAEPNETPRLLVVNHGRHRPTIEVFRIQLGETVKLAHEMTLQSPSITAANAIAATSPAAFYVSQDHYFTHRITRPFNKILPLLETLLALPLGRVSLVLFDTTGVRKVQTIASGIPFANGIAVSPDGSTLAVASTTRAEVWFYSKNQTSIAFTSSVGVPFSADNIAFAGDRLLVAGHPYLPAFMALKSGKSKTSPSYVSAILPRKPALATGLPASSWISRISAHADVVDVFKSDGSFLTSSSGAIVDLDTQTMFVMGLYDGNGVAQCVFVDNKGE